MKCSKLPSTRGRNEKGFTLVEVMMAGFLMALGISSAIIAMQSAFKQIDVARGTTVASQIIQSEMERLRMMSWTMIDALPASESFDGATFFTSNPNIAGKYVITRKVDDDSARPDKVKKISVSVAWKSYDNRSHQRTFTAIYAKNGLYDYYYTIAHP